MLAGGTSLQEMIEGLSIGVGAAIEPGFAMLVAGAIALDNLGEGLSIGPFVREQPAAPGRGHAARILGWTGLIGLALVLSAAAGWLLLRDLASPVLGGLLAFGAGGMLYLTVTDLIPTSQAFQYQQSAALATAAGFVAMLVLAQLV